MSEAGDDGHDMRVYFNKPTRAPGSEVCVGLGSRSEESVPLPSLGFENWAVTMRLKDVKLVTMLYYPYLHIHWRCSREPLMIGGLMFSYCEAIDFLWAG